ncbi:MAG: hypothetical protein OEY01_16790 [Desulfobulbaceae bacterium]|nr:hypothetical protein [Desulfobulbaceae bacterium]
MKKIFICLIAVVLFVTYGGSIYAKYKSGYEVVGSTEEVVKIKDKNGMEISVPVTSSKFKIGDKVKYDEKKNKITPDIEGC